MIINHKSTQIYFGNASDQLHRDSYCNWQNVQEHTVFKSLMNRMGLEHLVFLNQVHGIDGLVVSSSNKDHPSFATDGDYLITNQPRMGLGVVTADCIPVVCYDREQHAIGIAHAGWRGVVKGVVPEMIRAMAHEYGTQVQDIDVIIGPCARACCYQVGADFLQNIPSEDRPYSIQERSGSLYCDLVVCLRRQLERLGIDARAITADQALCTICNTQFNSYRRDGGKARQMTVVTMAADQMTVVGIGADIQSN